MVSSDGRDVVQMTADDYSASSPRWSPDGRYLGFLAANGDEEEAKTQVWTLDTRGGDAQSYTAVDQGVQDFAWSPAISTGTRSGNWWSACALSCAKRPSSPRRCRAPANPFRSG